VIPFLVRLLEITINNGTVPTDWKKATVVPIFKGGCRADISNYRPVSLTSVVSKIMEYVITKYIRETWEKTNWLSEKQHGFRPGYSCDSQLVTVCQDLADSLDTGERIDAIVIDFSKAFDLVPHDRLLFKISNSGLDSRILAWIKDFLTGRTQKVRIQQELSNDVQVTSGIPQGSVIGPLLFLAFINDIEINMQSTIRLFADDCIIYKVIRSEGDEKTLQSDLDKLWEWASINSMKINPQKSKSISFTKSRIKQSLAYSLGGNSIVEVNSCKYLGITIKNDLNWIDHVNITTKKGWRALNFVMRTLKKGNNNAKKLAYTSLVRPILEYGVACWDPYRKCQVEYKIKL